MSTEPLLTFANRECRTAGAHVTFAPPASGMYHRFQVIAPVLVALVVQVMFAAAQINAFSLSSNWNATNGEIEKSGVPPAPALLTGRYVVL